MDFRTFWAPLGAPEIFCTFCRPFSSFSFVFRVLFWHFFENILFSPHKGGKFHQNFKVFPPRGGKILKIFPPHPSGVGEKIARSPPIPLWGGGKIIADFAVFPPRGGGGNPSLYYSWFDYGSELSSMGDRECSDRHKNFRTPLFYPKPDPHQISGRSSKIWGN